MRERILEALSKLDASNDNHWTQDGLPRLETVRFMAAHQGLTREQVSEVAPGFSRSTASMLEAQPVLTAPVAEPTVVAPRQELTPEETVASEVASQRRALTSVEEFLRMKRAELLSIQHQLDLATKEKDRLLEALEPKAQSNQDAIRAYLDRQKEILEERRARKELLATSGIDLKLLAENLKAPIDAMRARRRR